MAKIENLKTITASDNPVLASTGEQVADAFNENFEAIKQSINEAYNQVVEKLYAGSMAQLRDNLDNPSWYLGSSVIASPVPESAGAPLIKDVIAGSMMRGTLIITRAFTQYQTHTIIGNVILNDDDSFNVGTAQRLTIITRKMIAGVWQPWKYAFDSDKNIYELIEALRTDVATVQADNALKSYILPFAEIVEVGTIQGQSISGGAGDIVFIKNANFNLVIRPMFALRVSSGGGIGTVTYYANWVNIVGYPDRNKYDNDTGNPQSDRFYLNQYDNLKYNWDGSQLTPIASSIDFGDTAEHFTGRYDKTDEDRPIYCRYLPAISIPSSSSTSLPIDFSARRIIKTKGSCPDGSYRFETPFFLNTTTYIDVFSVTNTEVAITRGSGSMAGILYIYVEYTKQDE